MTEALTQQVLDKALRELGEHFDAVQVLVTWCEGGVTKSRHAGVGNWFARVGVARNFIERDQANDAADLLAEKINPPTDDGESWKHQ